MNSVKKTAKTDGLFTYFLVEVTRLELTTPWSLTKCATKLRYTSKLKAISLYDFNVGLSTS